MLKKLFLVITSLIVFLNLASVVSAEEVKINTFNGEQKTYDTTTNYFGKVDDKTQISNPDNSVLDGYTLMSSNNGYELYIDKKKFNLGVKTPSGYIFYSDPQYYGYKIYASKSTGDEISTTTMLVNGKYSFTITKGSSSEQVNAAPTIKYTNIDNGFKAVFDYGKLGIIMNVYVTLVDGKLNVYVPLEEIQENGYEVTYSKQIVDSNGNPKSDENGMPMLEKITTVNMFYLTSFEFFPYFGAAGYYDFKDAGGNITRTFDNMINGYIMIPDGSGALVRYQYDRSYSTMYSKRVYGNDYGITTDTSLTAHLADDQVVGVPVFGVSHGYNQHAFLCAIKQGDGAASLYVEPFGYSTTAQTSYFRYYTRETYQVTMATSDSGTQTILPSKMYHNNYEFEYTFLSGDKANYSGMAEAYRNNYLDLESLDEKENISLGLNVLAQDYKKGLIFKNFIAMTKYQDLLNIVKDLESAGVFDFSISYMGFNRYGYYNNSYYKPKTTLVLGGLSNYKKLKNYLDESGYDMELCMDLLTSYNIMETKIAKKFNLTTFTKGSDSTLFEETYLRVVSGQVKDKILKYKNYYKKLSLTDINLEGYASNIYSYRYKGTNYSRSEAIAQSRNELELLSNYYNVSLVKANAFAYDYVSKIYGNYTSSSLYTYMTDSIPFISLVLSGYVEMYSEEINFIPDYTEYCLRLIEYNIYPYFTITEANSSKLRYTNSEGLYTSEYKLWEGEIKSFYNYCNNALKGVTNASMVSHEYLDAGVCKITYSNGVKIYINYNASPTVVESVNIAPLSYEVR